MKVVVLGKGGREHALAWKFAESEKVSDVIVHPGNPGMSLDSKISITSTKTPDFESLKNLLLEIRPDLIMIGPEDLLVDGSCEKLRTSGFRVFGPSMKAAKLEGSKVFSKDFMKRHKIPTADYWSFEDIDQAHQFLNDWDFDREGLVLKADGLAAGKGVFLVNNKSEALNYADKLLGQIPFEIKTNHLLIEKMMFGEELSYFALFDGESFSPIGFARDHKRLKDGNLGPNTGGMGCFLPEVDPELENQIAELVLAPLAKGMRDEGHPFQGVLFVGLMLTREGPRVLEFNVRFGDPETQTILPVIKNDFFELIFSACEGNLQKVDRQKVHCHHVVLASEGYPGIDGEKVVMGREVSHGLVNIMNAKVFYAGVAGTPEQLISSGGRVLGITAWADSAEESRNLVYQLVEKCNFKGAQWRCDIGQKE